MEMKHYLIFNLMTLLWLWISNTILSSQAAWFHRSPRVYYFSDDDKKFINSQEDCESKDANLVTVNGDGENQFLYESYSSGGQHWIGLYCNPPCNDDNFQWYSGSSDYRDWASGEDTDNGGYAVIAFGDGKWRITSRRDNQKRYICEKADGCQDTDRPCENGATCVADRSGGYTCNCRAGFRGDNCQNNINECNSDPCVHGSCIDRDNRYRCDCGGVYTGQHCETDVDECANGTDDCVRHQGDCVNHEGGYTCDCHDGYSGRRCGVNINECESNPCQQGGSCNDGINAYTCTCTAFYTGTHCDVDIDECDTPNFCNNGVCENREGGYQCTCNSGFKGDRCNTNINECNRYEGICQNGGTCTDTDGSYECTCEPGYTGHNCSTEFNECSSSPCDNGATCHDGINHYTCECIDQFTGTHCEEDVDECTDYDYCGEWNCTNTYGDFLCDCPQDHREMYCSTDTDECVDQDACHSHENCSYVSWTFNCTCENDDGNHTDKCVSTPPPQEGNPGEPKEDLTPLKNALIAGCVISSVVVAVMVYLLITDRLYARRVNARQSLSTSRGNDSASDTPQFSNICVENEGYEASGQAAKTFSD